MNKFLSLAFVALSSLTFSQVSVSLKANVLLETNSPQWKNINHSVESSSKNDIGYNIGLSTKIDLPVISLFVMPEIYYTNFKSTYTEPFSKTQLKAINNRIDVPLLVGSNVLTENVSVFAGPVLSYNLSQKDQWNDFKVNASNNFTVGYQFGGQINISNLILNARYEGSFQKNEKDFINYVISETVRYDSRPSFVILGLGYKF